MRLPHRMVSFLCDTWVWVCVCVRARVGVVVGACAAGGMEGKGNAECVTFSALTRRRATLALCSKEWLGRWARVSWSPWLARLSLEDK